MNGNDKVRALVIAMCECHGFGMVIAEASAEWSTRRQGRDGMADWLESLAEDIRAGTTLEQKRKVEGT